MEKEMIELLNQKLEMIDRLCAGLRNEIIRFQYLQDLQVHFFKQITQQLNLDNSWLKEEETSTEEEQHVDA